MDFGFSFADPAFDTQLAVNSIGLSETVIDFCAEGVERDAAPMILLDPGELGATEASGTTDLDALSAEILGSLESLFHGASKRDAALELESDVFSHELGVGLGMLDLDDIDVDFFAGHAAELFLELIDFSAFAADDDTGASGENGDAATVGGALDEDLGHGSRLELLLKQLADIAVFSEELAEFLFAGEPFGTPVAIYCDAQTDRIGFLSHNSGKKLKS